MLAGDELRLPGDGEQQIHHRTQWDDAGHCRTLLVQGERLPKQLVSLIFIIDPNLDPILELMQK